MRGSVQYLRRTLFGEARPGETLLPLDGIRGVAVAFIFLRHSWGLSGQPIPAFTLFGLSINLSYPIYMMSNGVDIFFVLSGFLLSRGFIQADLDGLPRPSLRRYARTRWFRIAPAYYLVLGVFVLIYCPSVLPYKLLYSPNGFLTLGSHLFMLQTVFPWSYGLWSAESPLWTLTIELIFYIVVPFWSVWFYRNRWRWSLPLCFAITELWIWFVRSDAAAPLSRFIVAHAHRAGASDAFARYFMQQNFFQHVFDFACGMTVAAWYCHHKSGKPIFELKILTSRLGPVIALLGVGMLLTAMWGLGYITAHHEYYDGIKLMSTDSRSAWIFSLFQEPAMAAPTALIIAAAILYGGRVARWSSGTWLRAIGVLGYSIYLWHMPNLYLYTQFHWLMALSPGARWIAMALFGAAVIGLISFLTYAFVEKPFIALGRKPRGHVLDDASPALPEPQMTEL
jgi:peptidoglycan/LPS O-acetylase OafA/YrhL